MTDGLGLPGAPAAADRERIVLHVDADCFYAACERLREPELRGEPVVVGMGYEPGETVGAVATASYEAREYGVESAMGISEALDRLPRIVDARDDPDLDPADAGYYRPVDMEFYESVAADVREILREHADVLRIVSIDEAYVDATDSTGWEVVSGFARHLTNRVADEVGVTVSIGVAPTMSAAKVASDREKPDGLVVVRPGEVAEFLAPLSVEEVHGVGPVTARKLRKMGVETAGDLAEANPGTLADRFGERGRTLGQRARGIDDREVTPRDDPKSYSRESAFAEPKSDPEPKRTRLLTLAEAVSERASRNGALYRTIGVKAVTPPFDVNTRERSLPGPIDEPELVERVALELFEEFADEPVRKLGVRVSNLSFPDGDQASLGGFEGAGQTNSEPTDSESAETDAPETIPDEVEAEESDPLPDADDDGDTGATDPAPSASIEPGQTTLSEFR